MMDTTKSLSSASNAAVVTFSYGQSAVGVRRRDPGR